MKKIYLVSLVLCLCCVSQNAAGETGTTPADGDGLTYSWVKIGNQYWMSENLRTTKFMNGDAITNGYDLTAAQWFALLVQTNTTVDPPITVATGTPAYTKHSDNTWLSTTDGFLYNWFAATDSRKVCPTGWKVPSDGDFQILEAYLGMPAGEIALVGTFANTADRGVSATVGTKLKSADRSFAGTNDFGFNGLPSGCRNPTGAFGLFNGDMWLWATTENPDNNNQANRRVLRKTVVGINRDYAAKSGGFSIRCVKDLATSIDKISASAKAVSTKIYTISGAPVRNNMETLAKGIYVKKTVYDNGQISVEKLIKKQD